MRILLTTTSGIGHLHPLIPLARAAEQAGHAIRVAAPASLGAALASRGLPHLQLPDYGPHHVARVDGVMRRLGPPGPGAEIPMFREVFGWAKTDSTLHAMRRAVVRWRPDLILHEATELSGPLAAEEAGVEHATVAMALRHTLEAWVPYMAEGAAELATAMGLEADPQGRRVLEAPLLTLVPPSLEKPGTVGGDRTICYRLTDIHVAAPAPAMGGPDPLVWITLGTEAWQVPGVMERVAPLLGGTAEALPRVRFLLTTGSQDAVLPPLPANVRVEAYVPQEHVLPACDVVVGHGGFNTTMAALRHGRPLVVMPLFSTDQFETASRLAAVGAAVAVTDPSAEVLREALERALSDPSMAATAAALAEEMAGMPEPADAIDMLLAGAVGSS